VSLSSAALYCGSLFAVQVRLPKLSAARGAGQRGKQSMRPQ
jgi:hypothetical protein